MVTTKTKKKAEAKEEVYVYSGDRGGGKVSATSIVEAHKEICRRIRMKLPPESQKMVLKRRVCAYGVCGGQPRKTVVHELVGRMGKRMAYYHFKKRGVREYYTFCLKARHKRGDILW